jgi:tetratricopeptide (TPR) repeat protein
MKDCLAVTPQTRYSDDQTYGFEPGPDIRAVDHGGDALRGDFCTSSTPFRFSVKLPEGNYRVRVILGDTSGARRQMAEVLRRFPPDRIPPADRPYRNLGSFYARLGDVEAVRRYQREFEAAVPVAERDAASRYQWAVLEAWARRDYAAASAQATLVRQALACANCGRYDLGEMWSMAGNDDSTLAALEPVVNSIFTRDQAGDALNYAPALNRLGEIYESKGNKVKAREYYERFIEQWRDADPNFQPRVAEAKRRLAALGTDSPRP